MRTLITILALGLATAARAQGDEDLGEAKGLDEVAPAAKTPAKTGGAGIPYRLRGYGLIEHRTRKHVMDDKFDVAFPNAEVGLDADATLGDVQAFLAGRAGYDDELEKSAGTLDQGGVRWRPTDRFVLVAGKERNRRSPGLIVSPSDFIHSAEALPGQRQERAGVWLVRASYQEPQQSADLFLLPVDRQRDNGMPADDAEYAGTAVRVFRQFANLDLSLTAGRLNDTGHAGASGTYLVANVWKVYAEGGYTEEGKEVSHLEGVSYEGSNDWSARVEYYKNGAGDTPAAATNLLFARTQYAIASVSFPEIADRFNVTETWIKSLEDRSWLSLARVEWLATDAQVVGATLVNLDHSDRGQHARRPFDWQASVDWQWNL